MDNQKPKLVVISIAVFASLLITIVGIGYAWFNVQITSTGSNSVLVKAANLGTITFYNGTRVLVSGVYPGWCETKKVKIQATGASAVARPYEIQLQTVNNTIQQAGESQGYITVAGELVSGETTKTIGNTGTLSTKNITIESGTDTLISGSIGNNDVHTYNLTFCFPEKRADQNSQQGKEYDGFLKVITYNTQQNSAR